MTINYQWILHIRISISSRTKGWSILNEKQNNINENYGVLQIYWFLIFVYLLYWRMQNGLNNEGHILNIQFNKKIALMYQYE